MTAITCTELTTERLADYLKFFDGRAFPDNPRWSSCYCYFPIHDPSRTDWEKQSAQQNRDAVCHATSAGALKGYLAYFESEVIGWCNAGAWSQYVMLSEQPEAHKDTTGVVFCFVVAPEFRGMGVATQLLRAACDGLRRQGLTAVQAKPLKNAHGPAANHLGPLSMYLKAGFEILRETTDGDVFVRKSLV